MTVQNIVTALPAGATPMDKVLLRAALIGGTAHFIDPDVDPQTYDPVDAASGAIAPVVAWHELLWWYDPDDSTTAHDGITCLVLDGGHRYKVAAVDPWHGYAVISRVVTALPDDESDPPVEIGDAYLVPDGAEGEAGDFIDHVAVYTARGYEYIPPRVGRLLYVRDELGYVHYAESGAWVAGLGNNVHAEESIAPEHLVQGLTFWIVQVLDQESEPSIVKGVNYVVGPSPSGALVGHTNDILTSDNGITRDFYQPQEGWEVYDLDTKIGYRFDGTAWVPQAGALLDFKRVFTATGSTTGINGAAYPYSDTVAPTTGAEGTEDSATITHTARRAGALLEFSYDARVLSGGVSPTPLPTIGLFRDSESDAVAWSQLAPDLGTSEVVHASVKFVVAAVDVASHTYSIRVVINGTIDGGRPTLSRRGFQLREFA